MIGTLIGITAVAAVGVGVISFVTASVLWTRVDLNEVHVVVGKQLKLYSSHKEYSDNGSGYFKIPEWIPMFNNKITKISLTMIGYSIDNFLTVDIDNVRFNCDISANLVVFDPVKAAQRFPNGQDELERQVIDVIKEAVRDTTTKSTIREIIKDRSKISDQIEKSIAGTVEEWGLKLKLLNLTDIKDAPDQFALMKKLGQDGKEVEYKERLTPIADISSQKEIEISAETRIKNADKIKNARMAEAEANELAETREILKLEKIGVAKAKKDESIAVADQKKQQHEELEKALTAVKIKEAEKVTIVMFAENNREKLRIDAEAEQVKMKINAEASAAAKKIEAEGIARAIELDADGRSKAITLNAAAEAKKIQITGEAKGKAIEAEGIASAKIKEAEAKALKTYDENALRALLGKDQIIANKEVGIAAAKALESGEKKIFIGGGSEGAKGFDLGKMIESLRMVDSSSADALNNQLARPNDLGFTKLFNKDVLISSFMKLTGDEKKEIIKLLKS